MRLYNVSSGMGYALRPPTGLRYSQRKVRQGVGRLGQTMPLLTRNCFTSTGAPGTEVVDAEGNVIYSCDAVAADPTLLNKVGSGGCPAGMQPVFYPGGQSECSVPPGTNPQCVDPTGVCGNFLEPGLNPNYAPGWNLPSGASFNDPTAWIWYPPNTTPTTPNPAIAYNANPLGAPYQTQGDCYNAAGYAVACGTPGAIVAGGGLTPVGIVIGDGPVNKPLSVQIQNVSRPGQSLQVGDDWRITVTGPSYTPVTVTAVQNGTNLGTSSVGSTDGTGTFTLNGTASAGTVGSWSESWAVGGQQTLLSFVVAAVPQNLAPPTGTTVTPQPPNSGVTPGTVINGTPTATTPVNSACGGIGMGPCIGPLDAGTWGLIAAGVLLFIMMGKK
jgi:hypothetical protein